MSQNILAADIAKTLGIHTLSLEEQSAFLAEIGGVILETSLTRLASELTAEQLDALEQYLDMQPEPEALLTHLLEHYAIFLPILETVIAEFKDDTLAVMDTETQE